MGWFHASKQLNMESRLLGLGPVATSASNGSKAASFILKPWWWPSMLLVYLPAWLIYRALSLAASVSWRLTHSETTEHILQTLIHHTSLHTYIEKYVHPSRSKSNCIAYHYPLHCTNRMTTWIEHGLTCNTSSRTCLALPINIPAD